MPRDRLNRTLTGVWDAGFGLVVGPAGAGKTTFLGQFAEAAGVPVAWYRADAADNTAAAFLAGLERSVAAAFDLPDRAPAPAEGEPAAVSDGLSRPWTSAEEAAAALEAWPGPQGLVMVDDLHVLFGSEAEAAFGRLVDYLPPTVAVVAAARRSPGFDVSRRRVSGELVEIGADDLRFRSWEVETLFREFYGEPLPPEDTAELARRTAGWPAGLTLFHLATQGKPTVERRRLVATLAANSKLVREYLTRHLMDELPSHLRRFLVDTSVLGRLTGPLCDELLGASSSRQTLEELERRQLFTSEVDRYGTYRYHEVLRVHLETVLVEEFSEAGATERYRRAAVLLEAAGAHGDAVRAHCRAADWAAAARLLGYQGERLAQDDGSWIDAVPDPLLASSPWLLLARARRYRAAGRLVAALDGYREAEEAFGQSPPAAQCRSERAALRDWTDPAGAGSGWSGAGWSGGGRGVGPGTAWVRVIRDATRRDPDAALTDAATLSGGTGRLAEAVAACLAGRLRHARRLFEDLALSEDASPALAVCARFGASVLSFHSGPDLTANGVVAAADLAAAMARPEAIDGAVAVVAELAAVAEEAERVGLPLVAELSRVAAAARADIGVPALPAVRTGIDGWPGALASLDAGLALLRRGEAPGTMLEEAADAFARLGAPVCEALARAALTAAPAGEAREAPEPGIPEALPTAVTLRCLGGFSLELDGVEVDLTAVKPRARAVLRVLALHQGRSVHRETLADALWPEAGTAAGLRSLQVAISALRRVIEPSSARGGSQVLVREGDSYRLALHDPAACDVAEFEAARTAARQAAVAGDVAVARAALERARVVYRGDLLPEDGPAEWVVKPRDRLRLQAVELATVEAGLALDYGDAAGAAAACTWALALDPYQDGLWRLLVRAHETAGDAAAAYRAGQDYERILGELGLPRPAADHDREHTGTEAMTG
jgi:DNA-binding SARP family transcriptional activator